MIKLLLLVKKYLPQLALLAVVIGICTVCYNAGYRAAAEVGDRRVAEEKLNAAAAQAKLEDYRLEVETARAEAEEAARAKEATWQAKFDQLTKDQHAKLQSLSAEYRRQLDGLRDRPERPAPGPGQLPEAPRAGCQGANGAELARGDAAFLAGFAHRAARLDAALQACYAALDELRSAAPSDQAAPDPQATP